MTSFNYETLVTLAHDQDLFAALNHLHSSGTPADVAALYDQLLRDAYWKHKNLPLATALATAGIHFCLTHAHLAPDPSLATALKSSAKAFAYNLASFTWPGWGEPGISPTPADIALGHQAAKLNLRLALELQKPTDKIRSAHWLLGASHLALKMRQEALAEFQLALPSDSDADHPLYEGYTFLARMLLNDAAAETQWNSLMDTLKNRADESAQFAHAQLTTALRVFRQATSA